MMVDCRNCRFFVHVRDMDPVERENAYIWVEKNRPGEPLLGYCMKYRRPVTRYRGSCSGFIPFEIKQHKLSEYLPGL